MRALSKGKLVLGGMALAAVATSIAAAGLLLRRAPDPLPAARQEAHPGQASPGQTPAETTEPTEPTASAAGSGPAVGYKVGNLVRKSDAPRDLILQISVEPRHFIREDMAALARQLNQDFPDALRLSAFILDDEYTARYSAPVANHYSIFTKALRGMYHLDRARGEEYIKFSTARGRRLGEIRITPDRATADAPER